jgi:hypothetical protein
MFLKFPVEQLIFITLTFPELLTSTREAHRRFNSLFNKVRKRCLGYLWTLEPQESGRIHYHLLLPVDFDARDGTDLDAWAHRDLYTDDERLAAMNEPLRAESDWWKAKASAYGFGRIEVAPVYSNVQAVRKYLIRQDWRQGHWPFEETKHVRFWGCSKNVRAGTIKLSFASRGGQQCRAHLKEWAMKRGCNTYEDLPLKLGKRWGYPFHRYLESLKTNAN